MTGVCLEIRVLVQFRLPNPFNGSLPFSLLNYKIMTEEKPKLKIFIAFHNNIFFEHYEKDLLFSKDYYTFCKIDKLPNNYFHLSNVIDVNQFPNFVDIGSDYGEYQGIYNIYKNPEIWKDLLYFGYSQYDKSHVRVETGETNITEQILNNLDEKNHISLETHYFAIDYNQKIMMDDEYPTKLVGNGVNVYNRIIKEYNEYYNTNHTLDKFFNKKINLCTSFIIPIKIFEKIMIWISFIIESGKLTKFFPASRVHGAGLLERFFGVALILENLNFIDVNILHLSKK